LDMFSTLDADRGTGTELGDSGRSGHTITEHQRAIGTTINPRRRHANLARAEPDDLLLEFVRVRPYRMRVQTTRDPKTDPDQRVARPRFCAPGRPFCGGLDSHQPRILRRSLRSVVAKSRKA